MTTKDFYLITLKFQRPAPCQAVMKEISLEPENKNDSFFLQPGVLDVWKKAKAALKKNLGGYYYLLKLNRSFLKDEPGRHLTDSSKLDIAFYPHGQQPYPRMGPFLGTIDADGAVLCVSEQQAREYMQFLEESKKGPYLLDLCMATPPEPTRNCRIVKDIVVNGGKGYWLAEVDPPYPAPLLPAKSLSKIILALKDLPVQGQPIAADVCYFDQNVSMGEEVESKRIDLQAFDEGTLWRPKDREDFYRSLRK